MTHDIPNPSQTTRTGRATLPALLVVGLLIGVTVSAITPGVRALHRDASAELLATRHIAQTLVRAVRGLGDMHRPAMVRTVSASVPTAPVAVFCVTREVDSRGVTLLRECLLSLPPPAA